MTSLGTRPASGISKPGDEWNPYCSMTGHGGSPVLAWRRQRRRSARSVLPPLERSDRDAKDLLNVELSQHIWTGVPVFTHSLLVSSSQKKLRQSSNSLPPGTLRAITPFGTLKPLPCSTRQGPPLRQTSLPLQKGWLAATSLEALKTEAVARWQPLADSTKSSQTVSAMALDLMPVTGTTTAVDPEPEDDKDQAAEDEFLLPAPEDTAEQHWFTTDTLEAQVRCWREKEPVERPGCAVKLQDTELRSYLRTLEVQECSADGDDGLDNFMFVSYMPVRVRPGEFLIWDPSADPVDDLDLADEDVAVFTTESAVDAGLRYFMAEALSDDLDEFEDEQEV